ncbi:MAG: endonuclease [Candidatus Thermoplasmatota archaeon]
MYFDIDPTELYQILSDKFGRLKWWPTDRKYHKKNGTDPRFEIIIGAILTQNTAWSNVERALKNLKNENILNLDEIVECNDEKLKELIRPSGFFNQKAKRVKNISEFFKEKYSGDLDSFFNKEPLELRKQLLNLKGIGPETTDSILLYAGEKPIFVVDAYTKRICKRLPVESKDSYKEIQKYFQKKFIKNYNHSDLVEVYQQVHALIVELCKNYCRKKPKCNGCPLREKCRFYLSKQKKI